MKIEFSREKMDNFLLKLGYTFHNAKETFISNQYHNKIVEYKLKVIHVYKGGKKIPYKFYDCDLFTKNQQVNEIFEREFKHRLLHLAGDN